MSKKLLAILMLAGSTALTTSAFAVIPEHGQLSHIMDGAQIARSHVPAIKPLGGMSTPVQPAASLPADSEIKPAFKTPAPPKPANMGFTAQELFYICALVLLLVLIVIALA